MGVSCVLTYPIPENKTGPHTVEALCKRLESLRGEKVGPFNVDLETFHSQIPTIQKALHVLHSTEYPMSCFSFIDSASGTKIVASHGFDQIIAKMKQFYAKKHPRVEVKGTSYNLRDFKVKIGAVILGSMTGFRGLLIEIDFQPATIPSDCMGIFKEFVSDVFESPNLLDSLGQQFKLNMDSPQTSSDVISQYLEHFLNFKISAMNAPGPGMSFGVSGK